MTSPIRVLLNHLAAWRTARRQRRERIRLMMREPEEKGHDDE